MQTGQEAGTSLIEVLIAISILSFGILGIVRMQTSAIANTSLAYQYSQAAQLAQSIAEDIRANPVAASAGLYQVSVDSDPPSFDKDCYRESCTPAELASWNVATWHALLTGYDSASAKTEPRIVPLGFNTGKLDIRCPKSCDEDAVRIITIYWDARHTGATGTRCQPESESDLTCFRLAQAL